MRCFKLLMILFCIFVLSECSQQSLDLSKSKQFKIDSVEISKDWDVLFMEGTNKCQQHIEKKT